MEDKYIKEIEVTAKEIVHDTPPEEIVEYYFQLLVNNGIRKMNLKIDQKSVKSDIKENDLDVTNFAEACKLYALEKENKKLINGEIIEDYLTKLKNENDSFSGLDTEYINIVNREDELKEEEKSLSDNVKETPIDVKALQKCVKDYLEDINPNKKEKKVDVVLEGTVNSYNKILLEVKKTINTQKD